MQILEVEQGSDEWFQHRCGIPTVSEFSRFITPARGDLSAQSVGYIADLIVESVEGPPEGMSSYWMDRGTSLEDEARSWYEFHRDCDVTVGGIILNKGAGWSPDGRIGRGGLEVKCPKPSTHVKWLMDGGLPTEHKPQCHGALTVGELDWLDFVSYCPGYKPLLLHVEPDKYTAKVDAALAAFLEQYDEAKRKILE